MEKLMPIVPGCRAVIVGTKFPEASSNIGKEVAVMRRATDEDNVHEGPEGTWVVAGFELIQAFHVRDAETKEFIERRFRAGEQLITKERNLMRIDGGDFEEEKALEDLTAAMDRHAVRARLIKQLGGNR